MGDKLKEVQRKHERKIKKKPPASMMGVSTGYDSEGEMMRRVKMRRLMQRGGK